MARQRLSALDLAFLCLEHRMAPMHFGGLLVFEPSPSTDARTLVALLAERAERLPQLRERVETTWCPPGGAVWTEDPAFRVDDHIGRHSLSEPGGLAALAGELMAPPLNLGRPLWHLDVIDGLEHGRLAVLATLHHAAWDGPGAVELGLSFFDEFQPQEPAGTHERDGAQPRPAARAVSSPGTAVDRLVETLTNSRESWGIASELLGRLQLPDQASPLLGEAVSFSGADRPQRRVELCRLKLADLQRVRARYGGTVNDVLLAIVSGALRRWLLLRGRDPGERTVRALVPVNRRQASEHEPGRNQLSGYLCELPVCEPDPTRRLHDISASMDRNKAEGPRHGAGAFPLLAELLPPPLNRVVTPIAGGLAPLLFDMVITNVPLPAVPLALAGVRLEEVYPIVPLPVGHAMSVAASGYGKTVCFGVYADSLAIPDVGNFRDSLVRALDDLGAGV